MVKICASIVFFFPFIVFTLRGRSSVEEPAFRRIPLDLFWVTEHKDRQPNFTEHSFLGRGCDEGVESAMSTCKSGQEDSHRFVVKPAGEDDLTAVLNHRLVISRMNNTGYWEGQATK